MSLIGEINVWEANLRAMQRQREQAAAQIAEQRRQFEAIERQAMAPYRRIGEGALFVICTNRPTIQTHHHNCRNCGAPFEHEETQCSYCRSER